MSWDSKVLWTEGLFLQPHHFQQSDRYTEALVTGLARRMLPYAWGVSTLEIDDAALKVGQFALKSVSGLTQDGTVFRVPMVDDHPPALDVPANTKDCVVLLTVPQRRQGASEVDLSGAEASVSRLHPSEVDVTDTMSQDSKAVTLGVGKMRLQFVLAVKADIPDETLRRHFAGQVKIGPVEEIRQLVNSALPGISMRPLPVAPRQIPYHAGVVYFQLDADSPYWGKLSTSGGLAVHVSGDYPGLTMELWAIRNA